MREELGPQVADVAARAGALVGELANVGRDALKEFVARDAEEHVATVADAATKQGRRATKQARRIAKTVAASAPVVAVAEQLGVAPQKRGPSWKQITLFAVITSIIASIAYYLSDAERRKKAMETANSIIEQGREIVRDFQGYDEEF